MSDGELYWCTGLCETQAGVQVSVQFSCREPGGGEAGIIRTRRAGGRLEGQVGDQAKAPFGFES